MTNEKAGFFEYSLQHNDQTLKFYFPSYIKQDKAIKSIKGIRVGGTRDWERSFLTKDIRVTPMTMFQHGDVAMKYIVLHDEDSKNETKIMIIFPRLIDHDRMFEVSQDACYDSFDYEPDFNPIYCQSAGFLSKEKKCHGRSETLGKESKPIMDNVLFRDIYQKGSSDGTANP